MRVFEGFDNLEAFHNPVVTVGSYDGVHRGHRELLGQIVSKARSIGGESVVITFSPHPRKVLEGISPKLLNSLDEKIVLLEQIGIDNLIVAPFTREFSLLSPLEFVENYLVDKVGVRYLIIGYNHHFGRGNEGNFQLLTELQKQYGFETIEVTQKLVDSHKVSSTIVRRVIAEGDMRAAELYLGFPYFIIGTVDSANRLTFDRESKLLPPAGTYDVTVQTSHGEYDTQIVVGHNLTLISSDIRTDEQVLVMF